MKFTIARAELARLMAHSGRVVESRNTMPILDSVLISAVGDGLVITATDLDIMASAVGAAEVETTGEVCVNAKLLGDIAKKAGGESVTFEIDGGRAVIKSGRSKFALETLPAGDFPRLGQIGRAHV